MKYFTKERNKACVLKSTYKSTKNKQNNPCKNHLENEDKRFYWHWK